MSQITSKQIDILRMQGAAAAIQDELIKTIEILKMIVSQRDEVKFNQYLDQARHLNSQMCSDFKSLSELEKP